MNFMDLKFARLHAGGELIGENVAFENVSTDTRTLAPGSLFVALSGPRFDGHDFCAAAAAAGAAALLVERKVDVELPQLLVDDTHRALQDIAGAWRLEFNIPVVGVTGSTGKTTVKQMLAAILAERGKVLATQGNLNNEIGVPLTLLALRKEHQFAVIEMGANHSGEISALANLARPLIGLVTNAGEAHLEGFGGIEGVVAAKGELYGRVLDGGTCVINGDQPWADEWKQMAGARRKLTFGIAGAHDFHVAGDIESSPDTQTFRMQTPAGDVQISIHMPGRHNVMNALAAAAAAWAAGATLEDIRSGLDAARNIAGRMHVESLQSGVTLVDDSYNANPLSMRAAIEWLSVNASRSDSESWLVMGDMGELGHEAEELHASIGEYAAEHGITRFYAVGELSRNAVGAFGSGARHFRSIEDLVAALRDDMAPGITILVKGSRAARMERVVASLREGGQR